MQSCGSCCIRFKLTLFKHLISLAPRSAIDLHATEYLIARGNGTNIRFNTVAPCLKNHVDYCKSTTYMSLRGNNLHHIIMCIVYLGSTKENGKNGIPFEKWKHQAIEEYPFALSRPAPIYCTSSPIALY